MERKKKCKYCKSDHLQTELLEAPGPGRLRETKLCLSCGKISVFESKLKSPKKKGGKRAR